MSQGGGDDFANPVGGGGGCWIHHENGSHVAHRIRGSAYAAAVTQAAEGPAPGATQVTAAAVVVLAEGLALLGYGGWLVVQWLTAEASNAELARELPWYFLVFGVLVVLVAVGLFRRMGFAYGATVAMQLLCLPIAWQMASAAFWLGAIPLAGGAVTALVALLSPAGRAAFGR
jgi:hypothetical protein